MKKEEDKQLDELRKDFYAMEIQNCEDLVNYCYLLVPRKQVKTVDTNEEESTPLTQDVEK